MAKSSSGIKSRARSTYITSLVVIALVLFFLNLFVAGAIFYKIRQEKALEETWLAAFLPDYSDENEQRQLGEWIKEKPWVREFHYVSKDSAKTKFLQEYGQEGTDFFEMVGRNPLQASYSVRLKYDYVTRDKVAAIEKEFRQQEVLPNVEAEYPIDEIEQLKENTEQMLTTSVVVGVVVLLIAFFIINSTVRLSIYSRRLMIRSMQLIGATKPFIRAPFLRLGVLQGIIGAIIADLLLVMAVFAIDRFDLVYQFEGASTLLLRVEMMMLLGGIIIFGALLGWLSSRWAVNRFLGKSLDQLM